MAHTQTGEHMAPTVTLEPPAEKELASTTYGIGMRMRLVPACEAYQEIKFRSA